MSMARRVLLTAAELELQEYFEKQAVRRPTYRGQLDPAFQEALASYHRDVKRTDCDFYHTHALSGGELVKGDWDLRHSERAYLGGCDLAGKRVIEYGPASGGISQFISAEAAELVVFDLPFGTGPELVPHPEVDMALNARSGANSAERLRNAWWYMKRELGYEANAVYADIYDQPDDLGRFDVAVLCAILLHLSGPFKALQQAAAITTETIVVTDVYSAPSLAAQTDALRERVPSLVVFNPTPAPVGLIHWWALSPELITHMLRQLGFTVSQVTTHSPTEMESRPPMFTVVAHRKRLGVALPPLPAPVAQPPVETDGLPVPTPHLRFMVSGTEDVNTFLILGKRAYDAMTRSLEHARIPVADLGRVLDFGCGVGRVTRHWRKWDGIEVHGTDMYEKAIEWDRESLPFATFKINELAGPLDYPDGHFGLIYALSVFTHLPIEMQMLWFEELVRLLRPGGVLYFTTHGQHYVHMLNAEHRAEFSAGRVVVTGDEQPGSNHCAAFHPPAYVMSELLGRFNLTLLEFTPCGARGNPDQDSYLLRKGSSEPAA